MTEADFDKYTKWIKEGKSFSFIREDLLKQGVPENEIKSIIKLIDEQISESELHRLNSNQSIQWIFAGSILTVLSIFLFFIGIIPIAFFAAAGFASGTGMIYWGVKLSKGSNRFQKSNRKESFRRRTE